MIYPLVSIIIVNWNGKEVFKSCLESLESLSYPEWELIVVDNGSTDKSDDLASNYKLKFKDYFLIKNNQNLGFATANNQGYKKSTGEYILLLNNDTKITPNFLTSMMEKMETDLSIGAMQPKIYLMDKPGFLDNTGTFLTKTGFLQHWGFMEQDNGRFDKETDIFSAKGACLLTRRKIVEKIGLFDDSFGSYFEESDFCWRVWLMGYKVIYYPKAKIWHKLGATSKQMNQIFINYNSFKNRIASLFKNLDNWHLLTILLPHLMILCILGTYYLVKLELRKSWMVYSAMLWNLLKIGTLIKKRIKIQNMRVVKDKELFKITLKEVDIKNMFAHFKKVEANF